MNPLQLNTATMVAFYLTKEGNVIAYETGNMDKLRQSLSGRHPDYQEIDYIASPSKEQAKLLASGTRALESCIQYLKSKGKLEGQYVLRTPLRTPATQ